MLQPLDIMHAHGSHGEDRETEALTGSEFLAENEVLREIDNYRLCHVYRKYRHMKKKIN